MANVDRVVERIEEALATGLWRNGEALPKARSLCKDWGISASTLVEGILSVASKGLVHKKGKFWIAGPSPEFYPETIPSTSNDPPTILIVSHQAEEWGEFHRNLLAGFVISVGIEANRHGVRLYPVLTGEVNSEAPYPLGKNAIRKFARQLGSSFLGCIFTPMRSCTIDMDEWLVFLSGLGRKVVWMQDENPAAALHAPRFVYRMSFGDWAEMPKQSSASLALRTLYKAGHRHIAIPCNDPSISTWLEVRIRLLQQELAQWPEMTLTCILQNANCSDEVLLRDLPTQGITAILAPHDALAVRYFRALHRLGIRVPEQISILSFDNLYTLKPTPVSTIDFGLEQLGYQAFHILFGVIPIKAGHSRQILGHAKLVDNGSVSAITR